MKVLLIRKLLNSPEAGMSLFETLTVIFMVAVILSVSTPPLIVGMATRIQNRRAEQAMNIAQKEMERIRLIVDQGDYEEENLPPVGEDSNGDPITTINELKLVAPPDDTLPAPPCDFYDITDCYTSEPSYNEAWFTQDGEFLVQTFREEGIEQDGQVVVFRVGVRVYSKVAEEDIGDLRTELAPLYLSSGAGERVTQSIQGQGVTVKRSQFPLAVLYGDFTRGDMVGSLERYREFLD